MTRIVHRSGQSKDNEISSRQRFLERNRGQIKKAINRKITGGNATDIGQGGVDVTVPKEDLHEPSIHHGPGGVRSRVFPGNKEYSAGDRIDKSGGGGPGDGEEGEAGDGQSRDSFIFHISEEEFLQYLFEDLALPNLTKRNAEEVEQTKPRYAGTVSQGPHSKLDLARSKKKKMARLTAAGKPYNDKILALLEEEKAVLLEGSSPFRISFHENGERPRAPSREWTPLKIRIKNLEGEIEGLKADFLPYLSKDSTARVEAIEENIAELQRRKRLIPAWNESTDLRFRYHAPEPLPTSKAVMICLMDVSGSMGDEEKDKAKIFYFLLNRFLKQQYKKVDVVFIRHTTTAEEVDERTFFYDQESGGTIVSSGLKMVQEVLKRYPENEWNIYGAQASDGDNWNRDDNALCQDLLRDILPKVQGYFYTQIKGNGSGELLGVYESVRAEFEDKFWTGEIKGRQSIWPLFREFFKKKEGAAAAFSPTAHAAPRP